MENTKTEKQIDLSNRGRLVQTIEIITQVAQ